MSKNTTQSYPKNPLAQALGMVLKRRREIMGLTSSDIAELIGLGASYYRLIESGNNNLHISNTFKLSEAFQGKIDLNAISSFISLTYYAEAVAKKRYQEAEKEKQNNKEKLVAFSEGFKEALIEIGQTRKEEKLDALCTVLLNSDIFSLLGDPNSQEKDSDVKKELGKSSFVFELEDFLFNYEDFHKPKDQQQDDYLTEFLNDIPSIYLEYLSESKDGLMRLPVTIGWQGLWEWEEESKEKFKSLIAVLKESELLNNQDNLNRYKYTYLWEKDFQGINFIYLDDKKPKAVKEKFKKFLKNSLKKSENTKRYLDDFEDKMDLVEFKYCPKEEFDSSIFRNDDEEYNATWIFNLHNKSNIGFTAKINPVDAKMTEGLSLPYRKTKTNLIYLEELWNSI